VDPERLTVTVEQAGELLGISRALAYELVRRGQLPSLRLGRRVVVPREALLAMIRGESGPTSSGSITRRS
jgi:excisionase family DNA binding protein